jgi:hypothetical protein
MTWIPSRSFVRSWIPCWRDERGAAAVGVGQDHPLAWR